MNECIMCGSKDVQLLSIPNWKFDDVGFKDVYEYGLCCHCGCLFKMDKGSEEIYTNEDYYVSCRLGENKLKWRIIKLRDKYVYCGKKNIIGKLINRFIPAEYFYMKEYMARLSNGESFLDVGCRDGYLAYELKNLGICAYGTEPFRKDEIHYDNGLVVYNKFLKDMDGKFDVIFYNNVFEHLENPEEELLEVKKKLKSGGVCGIVVPGIGELFENYKENAYTIQAPQHICLHTFESMGKMVEKAGFEIIQCNRFPVYDWYIKSEMLRNKKYSRLDESNKVNRRCLPKEAYTRCKECYDKDVNQLKGDMYHFILTPNKKMS